jgi:hypothetical protein
MSATCRFVVTSTLFVYGSAEPYFQSFYTALPATTIRCALMRNTMYYYQVVSQDPVTGVTNRSGDFTFTTPR